VRWLADECVDAPLVRQLREAGHDVAYIVEGDAGATDGEIISRAHAESRLLLTEDKDFGELAFRWGRAVPGVVLLRVEPDNHALKRERLNVAIDRFGDALFGRFTVVEERRLRSRPLPG
jgi:predicted nuclease of predicted toxin-antitoxin system